MAGEFVGRPDFSGRFALEAGGLAASQGRTQGLGGGGCGGIGELSGGSGWLVPRMAKMTSQRRRVRQMRTALWRLPSALLQS